jgi:hypothetical protein
MVIIVVIGCLDFDKRKGLVSLLKGTDMRWLDMTGGRDTSS